MADNIAEIFNSSMLRTMSEMAQEEHYQKQFEVADKRAKIEDAFRQMQFTALMHRQDVQEEHNTARDNQAQYSNTMSRYVPVDANDPVVKLYGLTLTPGSDVAKEAGEFGNRIDTRKTYIDKDQYTRRSASYDAQNAQNSAFDRAIAMKKHEDTLVDEKINASKVIEQMALSLSPTFTSKGTIPSTITKQTGVGDPSLNINLEPGMTVGPSKTFQTFDTTKTLEQEMADPNYFENMAKHIRMLEDINAEVGQKRYGVDLSHKINPLKQAFYNNMEKYKPQLGDVSPLVNSLYTEMQQTNAEMMAGMLQKKATIDRTNMATASQRMLDDERAIKMGYKNYDDYLSKQSVNSFIGK